MTIARDKELSELVLARFDKLVKQEEVIWQDSTPRYVSASPFNVPTYKSPQNAIVGTNTTQVPVLRG